MNATTTFLEYLCAKLLGQPAYSKGGGESYWPCPACSSDRFHTMPDIEGKRHRAKCFSCGWMGDAHDLLRQVRPRWNYGDRKAWIWQLRNEYNAQPRPAPTPQDADAQEHADAATFLPRGHARSSPARPYDEAENDPRNIALAWANLTDEERAVMGLSVAIARRKGVSAEGLAHYAYHFHRWVHDTNADHMAGCADPDCDWYCCRLARGWTVEQIREDAARHWAEKRAREEESRRRVAELVAMVHRRSGRPSLNGVHGLNGHGK